MDMLLNWFQLYWMLLDRSPGAPKPSNPPCKPQAKRKAGENARWKEATMQGWLLCFPKTEITVFRFYDDGHLSQGQGKALIDMFKHPDFRLRLENVFRAPLSCT